MKGILKLENGKELTVEIDENTLKSIEEPKKTGYERVEVNKIYYYFDGREDDWQHDDDSFTDKEYYETANYYSDKTVAKNNARADTLMRKLRRFAVEHREEELNWANSHTYKYYIYYDHVDKALYTTDNQVNQKFGSIYFDTQETAEVAIKEFKDELIWYFTEYKDSL